MASASIAVSAPIDDAVRDAFSMFRRSPGREWARDFVLSYDRDPGADIAGVQNPAALDAATLYTGTTVVAAPAGVETGGEAAAENTYLLLPVWSRRGVTVGHAIERVRGIDGYDSVRSLPKPGEAPMWTIGRFATDNRGETLVVGSASFTSSNVGKRPTVGIKHFRVLSSTQRKQVFLHCDKEVLLRTAQTLPAPLAFAQSAILFQGVVQDRPCIICGFKPRPGALCVNRCPLPFETPTSCLDFDRLKRNYTYFCGDFGGTSEVFMRQSLKMPFVNVQLYSSMLNRKFENQDLSMAMKTLAIQDRMKQFGSVDNSFFNFSMQFPPPPTERFGAPVLSGEFPPSSGAALSNDDVADFLSGFGEADVDVDEEILEEIGLDPQETSQDGSIYSDSRITTSGDISLSDKTLELNPDSYAGSNATLQLQHEETEQFAR